MMPRRIYIWLFVLFVGWTLSIQSAPVITTSSIEKTGNLEHMPEKALVVMHMKSFPNTIEKFKNSFFYRTFLDYRETDAFKNAAKKDSELVAVFRMITSMLDELPKAFTGEFTFGFIPDGMKAFFFVEGDEREFKRVVESVFIPIAKEIGEPDISFEKIGELNKIKSIDSDDGLFFRVDGPRLLFAFDDEAFDILKNMTKPLPQNPLFKETLAKQDPSPDFLAFVNLREVLRMAGEDADLKSFLNATGFAGIEGIVLTGVYKEKGVSEKAVFYAPKGLSGALSLLNRAGSEPTVEKYVPENFVAAARLSVGSLNEMYKEFAGIMAKHEESAGEFMKEISRAFQDLEKEFGISVEKDVLPALGGEFGFALKSPDNPLSFVILAEVKDKKKIEELAKTLEKSDITFTVKEYNGFNIHIMDGIIIRPSYVFLDNYIIISPTSSILEEIIDVKAGAKSLLDKEDYRKAFAGIPKKNVIAIYADVEKILPKLFSSLLHTRPAINNEDGDFSKTLLSVLQKNLKGIQGDSLAVTADKNTIFIQRSSSTASLEIIMPLFMSFYTIRSEIMMPFDQ